MTTVLFALIIVPLSVGGLGLGVLLGRTPLRGSCGGLPCIKDCEACSNHRKERA